jgi:predicted dehydrogenase
VLALPAPAALGRPLRFGLVGTGHWATVTHARALASTPGVTFAAVFGRRAVAADRLAAQFGATACKDFDTLLADVDAVAFSVPPEVQSEFAVRAARAGKHLLLEKPVAFSSAAADALVAAANATGVATIVFLTWRFRPDIRTWLADRRNEGDWSGAAALWLRSVYADSSPFNTAWRRERGSLWDLGPHVISLLWGVLGPVESVIADHGVGDITHLVLHHSQGKTSTATMTLGAPEAASSAELRIWGNRGVSALPQLGGDPVAALRVALTELVANARSANSRHACDVRFGRDITRVLSEAQAQLDTRRAE